MASVAPAPGAAVGAAADAACIAMSAAGDHTTSSASYDAGGAAAGDGAGGPGSRLDSQNAVHVLDSSSRRHVYMTLITSDSFVPGAVTLAHSLRRCGCVAPLAVLVTPSVTKAAVYQLKKKCGYEVIKVADIANPAAETVHVEGWVNSGYTKLHIWNQTQFDRIVYIDADAVVVANVDHLFDLTTNFAAAPDVFPPDKFNAGVLVIEPSSSVFADMLSKVSSLGSHDGGDTGFLNAYYPTWYKMEAECRLPFGCNAQRMVHWFTYSKQPGYWESIKPLCIIHYSSTPKPWDPAAKKGPLELQWWKLFTEAGLSFGVPSV